MRVPRNRSASNLLDEYHTADTSLDRHMSLQSSSQGLAELVDFLKNYEPPSDSFMSQPYDEDDDRGRWSRLRLMGGLVKRSKSVPKSNHQIKLPDSAVSGTTTGGHRHIAISIPIEASPIGAMPRSQYPVYPSQQTRQDLPLAQRNANHPTRPVRYTNEKGVVTVLRSADEQHDPQTTNHTFPGFHRYHLPPVPGPPPSKSLPLTKESLQPSSTRQDKIEDEMDFTNGQRYFPVTTNMRRVHPPAANAQSTQVASVAPRRISSAHSNRQPAALSSRRRTNATRPSIDGIIAMSAEPGSSSVGRGKGKTRPKSGSSAMEDEKSVPESAEGQGHPHGAQSATLAEDVDSAIHPWKGIKPSRSSDSSLTISRHDVDPATSLSTTPTRRDKVDHLKRRDIATARDVKQRGSSVRQSSQTRNGQQEDQALREPICTLSPIMVVTNIAPVADHEQKKSWGDRKRKDLEISTPAAGYVTKVEKHKSLDAWLQALSNEPPEPNALTIPQARRAARGRGSLSPRGVAQPSNPTPPVSPLRSSQLTRGAIDRTSLLRRREWTAAKGRSRRVQDAMDAMRMRMQGSAVSKDHLDDIESVQRDQEFLKLYEAYREHRLQDMDRRVRRLERHGDVWLRALLPVLQNLNRADSAGEHDDLDRSDGKDAMSDDEMWALPERGRSHHRHSLRGAVAKRTSQSTGENGGEREEAATNFRSSRYSDDVGEEALEVLMRDLAGAARERLGTEGRPAAV